jgi:flagellar biosynthesis/type III secretory pathway chaperone
VSDSLQDLTDVLTAQAAELRGLVSLLDDQQAALTRADTAAVAALVSEQAPILRRLLQIDRRRQAVAMALARHLGIDPGPPSLTALLARIPSPPRAITALQAELRDLLVAVDRRNRRNAYLLQRAIACVDGLMRAVAGPPPEPAPVYAATGQPAAVPAAPRLLDRSA